MNRELWLHSAVERLNALLFEDELPKVEVSCGWPSTGALTSKHKVLDRFFRELEVSA